MLAAKHACVIGWPIEHSRSPLIHRHWLRQYGISGDYTREAVAPDRLAAFLASFVERGFVGCNVTMPHKQAVFHSVAVTDELTRRLGVVNTVYHTGEALFGCNTDGYGFLANVKAALPGWSPGGCNVVVLGAGGAARAIVGMLLEAGAARVVLANRSGERAEALAREWGPPVAVARWDDRAEVLGEAGLLVNATSLGMKGQPPLELSLSRLPPGAPVADLVYVPLETSLLGAARARGNPTVDGLGMLLHQAVPGFERWFGRRPEVTAELRALLVRDIGGGA